VARGFTLIEMLVVVLLIVLIAAIVGPLAISEIGRTSMKEAEQQVEAAAMLARADAQRRGAVVQLLARPADEVRGIGVELISIDLTSDGASHGSGDESAGRLEDGLGAGADSTTPGKAGDTSGGAGVKVSGGLVREKSILILPLGVRMQSVLVDTEEASNGGSLDAPGRLDAGGGRKSDSAGEGVDAADALMPLCVFFPDGQIVASTPRYLVSRSGRAVSIQINAWTGRVTATTVEKPGARDESANENEPTSKTAKSTGSSASVPEDGGGE